MKKNVFELKEEDMRKVSLKKIQESPKIANDPASKKKNEKKNTIKNYNEFVRMIIKEESKEKPSLNQDNNITPMKEKEPK